MSTIRTGTTTTTAIAVTGDTTGNLILTADNGIIDASATTGAINLPKGTTAQRPSSPTLGATRYNTTNNQAEYYNGTSWFSFNSTNTANYTGSYVIVAGGGGGGGGAGNGGSGGGGGGGFLSGTQTLLIGTTYSFVIGSGGAYTNTGNVVGANGSNTTGLSLTAIGGGGGGARGSNSAGVSGGSGGGGAIIYSGGTGVGGSATSGQGSAGGTNTINTNGGGAGGGGATVAGTNASSGASGTAGGDGAPTSLTGSAVYYGGGGGGGAGNTGGNGGAGGAGGGATGASQNPNTNSVNATANTGGGGGGSGNDSGSTTAGSNGGSGVVILSVPTASYTGTITGSPTVTTYLTNTIMKFTSSGSYTA